LVSDQSCPRLDALARDLLFTLEHPALGPFLALWPRATRPEPDSVMPAAALPAAALPVVGWLSSTRIGGNEFAHALVEAVCRSARSLEWRQTYSVDEIGAEFLRNYGYTEIVGPNAPLYSPRLCCGFLLLGPLTLYPRHHHEAEEIYVILRGRAGWLQGDAVWRQHRPGTLIHHARGEPHAMRTADQPLLALYLWRGENLGQTARLEMT
jgi:mannose-6-phosphate isomerase-like protein (cupin superfamily)